MRAVVLRVPEVADAHRHVAGHGGVNHAVERHAPHDRQGIQQQERQRQHHKPRSSDARTTVEHVPGRFAHHKRQPESRGGVKGEHSTLGEQSIPGAAGAAKKRCSGFANPGQDQWPLWPRHPGRQVARFPAKHRAARHRQEAGFSVRVADVRRHAGWVLTMPARLFLYSGNRPKCGRLPRGQPMRFERFSLSAEGVPCSDDHSSRCDAEVFGRLGDRVRRSQAQDATPAKAAAGAKPASKKSAKASAKKKPAKKKAKR